MTAAAANQLQNIEVWKYHVYTLTSGNIAYQNALAVVDTNAGTGTLLEGGESTTYAVLGLFDQYVDATSVAKSVRVNFLKERTVKWFANDPGVGAIAATDLGKMAFVLDDKTATITPTGHSPLGQILDFDSTKGVAIDIDTKSVIVAAAPTISNFTSAVHAHSSAATGGTLTNPIISGFTSANHTHADQAGGGGIRMQTGATLSFTGTTCSLTAATWTHYDVPTSSTSASKIVVAATGTRGDLICFSADGAKNLGTVTYYSGTYAMTAALTAEKTHKANAVFDGTNWIFDAVFVP